MIYSLDSIETVYYYLIDGFNFFIQILDWYMGHSYTDCYGCR